MHLFNNLFFLKKYFYSAEPSAAASTGHWLKLQKLAALKNTDVKLYAFMSYEGNRCYTDSCESLVNRR